MSLKAYKQKRKFTTTTEPVGVKKTKSTNLIFVIQRHAARRLHYDFRLEMDGVLKSWAVPKGPSLDPADKRLAVMVEDHPFDYKDFEGNIPKGNYGAGQVEIWDKGTYTLLEEGSKISGSNKIKAGMIKFTLKGKKLKGNFVLAKMKTKEDNAWLLIKEKDKFVVSPYDAEKEVAKTSTVNRFLKQKKHPAGIDKKPSKSSPKMVKPMLAQSAQKPFDNADWVFEIKWDGYRAIADLRNKTPLLYSRNGISFLQKFEGLLGGLIAQTNEMILDGEVVAYNEKGVPDFQQLQKAEENPDLRLVYHVFDLLWLNGHSIESLPLLQRKELLQKALQETEQIKYCDHIIAEGTSLFKEVKSLGLEGIIAKRAESVYKKNYRSSEWLKIKHHQTDEVIICGFTAPKGSRKNFGSLILGRYVGDKWVYCGHTGTGFNASKIEEIYQLLKKDIVSKCPFDKVPKTNDKPTWVKPKVVIEIKFTAITRDAMYRHPVFIRLRDDKVSTGFKSETMKKTTEDNDGMVINRKKVNLTNQDKIYFPKLKLTKGDVVNYYQAMASYILPYLKNRPLSLNRFPGGITETGFYQKDAGEKNPEWIKTHAVYSESTDKYIDYIICNDQATLAYLNNLGCIDLNPWSSTILKPENPGYMVLDLDPSEKNSFDELIEVTQYTKELLDKLAIEGYCKTSGKSGMHIYIPLGKKYDYDVVKDFAHLLMKQVNEALPSITTLERSLKKRDKKKIYLDYLQNRRGQTLASVYSLRPTEEATVSTPLEWTEIKRGLKPTDFTVFNVPERIEVMGDLFKPVLGKGVNLAKALQFLDDLSSKV